MPSWNRRKKKTDGAVDVTAMATAGRYRMVTDHPSPRLTGHKQSVYIIYIYIYRPMCVFIYNYIYIIYIYIYIYNYYIIHC